MKHHCTTDKCPQILDSSCVFYEGASLIFSGINTNDSVEVVIQKLNLKLESIPGINLDNYFNKQEINNFLSSKADISNKAIDFSVVNDILYPSVKAVDDFVKSQRLEVPFANATSVAINHNLDKLCSVTISLDNGSFALCDYYNIDNNNILVEFSTQQTGKIILI